MKPKTYCQLYVHLVFAVKNREALLNDQIRPKVFKYMSGVVSTLGHKSIIIDGTSDHVHLLIGLNPSKTISEVVQNVKRSTSLLINKEKFCMGKFSWQEGYGAFSCSHSNMDRVYNYILNQENHHKARTFKQEFLTFLEKLKIEFDEKYLFRFIEDV